MKGGRLAIRGCSQKKSNSLWSLPDEMVVKCLAHLSRLDLAAFAMTSQRHRCLVDSSELCDLRWEMGCIEASLFVCLHFPPETSPRWFIFHPVQRRLRPIYPRLGQSLSSSFVKIDRGIFVIGGSIKGDPTAEVWFLDCFKHTWYRIPPMKMPRVFPSASLIDGKIYVFGGLRDNAADPSNWAEVFDLKTRTWEFLFVSTPKTIFQNVVIDNKELYAVDKDGQVLSFSPSKLGGTFVACEKTDHSMPRYRNDWCLIGTLLFCRAFDTLWWCEPSELDWKQVKGLEEELPHPKDWGFYITKVFTNSAGNIVILWHTHPRGLLDNLDLWCAEVSVEKRMGSSELELWGKFEWASAVVGLLDYLPVAFEIHVLYADYVLVV
ncbi:unnamed protein product [Arabis nemorensis]|uniref:F-box domain-containing protein n=1 Tax=Arabis nemorensis TaxID=586526 RepID=A0A565BN89_9BRAS|nr:unnamed protein product [Arabis nemorensis]